ncbi:MAG: BspA family leucine-rich repeat surface protein, partial [Ruminococcus sp.]|nr:BspA family leucine-rich repeat surface protein [Ruminococcus sp.]
DMSNFDTSNVTNMSSMFGDCSSLQSLDMSNFDTSNVTNMSCMFANCVSLQSLDLSSFDTSNVTNMTNMFYEDSLLKTIIVGDKWNTSNVNDSSNMFLRCISLVGGNGTKYYGSHIDKRYALIDTPDTPGYFTLPDKILYGDANCSGDVRMNDAVLIMLVLANGDAFDVGGTDKLAITEKGRINADCYHPGSGLTNMDATAIQKYLIGKNALPE